MSESRCRSYRHSPAEAFCNRVPKSLQYATGLPNNEASKYFFYLGNPNEFFVREAWKAIAEKGIDFAMLAIENLPENVPEAAFAFIYQEMDFDYIVDPTAVIKRMIQVGSQTKNPKIKELIIRQLTELRDYRRDAFEGLKILEDKVKPSTVQQ